MHSGTNLPQVGTYNQSVVLEAIRLAEGISRVEIAHKTGLTAQSVSNIVTRLIEQQLVLEIGRDVSSGGKPRVKLQVNPGACYAVGVQLDRDEISLVLVDLNSQVLQQASLPTELKRGPWQIIDRLAEAILALVSAAQVPTEKVLGIGIAAPGPLDHLRGIIYDPPNFVGWTQVPLKALIEQKTGYPVVVDNDATAAAIGERWAGNAQAVRNFAFVYVGMHTGIGAGLFIEGRVYRGSTTNAGELGHVSLNIDGPLCSCGNSSCLEVLCNTGRLVSQVKQGLERGELSSLHGTPELTYTAIQQAAMAGDDLARRCVTQNAHLVGRAVVSLVNLLDVEMIVLGGKALRDVGPLYEQEVQQVLNDMIVARTWRRVKVTLSQVGEDAAAVRAAALILYECYTPQLLGLSATVN